MMLRCAAALLLALSAARAGGADLLEVYRRALSADATYLAARATAEAGREALPQAKAGLLPQLSINVTRTHNNTEQSSQPLPGQTITQNFSYPALAASVNLRQPLLRLAGVAGYRSAEAQVVAVEATLAQETQAVALRVSAAYFDTMVAREKVNSVLAQKEAYRGQLAASERGFATGYATRTDIDEARARYDAAVALEIELRHTLRVAERTLGGIVNERIDANALSGIEPARLGLGPPTPAQLGAWVARAGTANPELLALRATVQAAEQEVEKSRAAHLPTLDLVASRSHNESDTNTSIGSRFLTSSVGVQLAIPLYAGGQIESGVRQARATLEKVRQQYESARRQVEIEVERQYGAVEKGIARIRALEQAERSAEQAVISSRRGVQAGTRHSVDVLNALQQLSAAQQELVQARYVYAFDRLKLKAVAGALGEADIAEVTGWMGPRR